MLRDPCYKCKDAYDGCRDDCPEWKTYQMKKKAERKAAKLDSNARFIHYKRIK